MRDSSWRIRHRRKFQIVLRARSWGWDDKKRQSGFKHSYAQAFVYILSRKRHKVKESKNKEAIERSLFKRDAPSISYYISTYAHKAHKNIFQLRYLFANKLKSFLTEIKDAQHLIVSEGYAQQNSVGFRYSICLVGPHRFVKSASWTTNSCG